MEDVQRAVFEVIAEGDEQVALGYNADQLLLESIVETLTQKNAEIERGTYCADRRDDAYRREFVYTHRYRIFTYRHDKE